MSCDLLQPERHENYVVAADRRLKKIEQSFTAALNGDCEDSLKIAQNAKVLILKSCESITSIMSHSELLQNLQNSQIFVIIVRFSGIYNDNELKQLRDKIAKPIILQIDSSDTSRLFFTNRKQIMEEVKIDESNKLKRSVPFDLNFICNLLHSKPENFGTFSFDLFKLEIDNHACFNGNRLIDLAVERGCLLTLKFLMLFQPDIEAVNEDKKRILEIAAEKGNVELLKTILGIPVDVESFEGFLKETERHALYLMSEEDLSLLMIAARSGKNDLIRFLLRSGLNVNFLNNDKKTACDFAWDEGHHDSVIELIKADSPFPDEFDLNKLSDESELWGILEERETLHEQIESNQLEEVTKFVEKNPKVKCAYDQNCQCALVTALESRNFEIYSFLCSKGFTSGIDGDHKKILLKLTDTEKNQLKISNRQYFPTNENGHIMNLLSRSRLSFESEQKNFGKIQKYFEALDAISEVRPILKVMSMTKKLDIIFDFNRYGIESMDPTQCFEHAVVRGRTIYENGNILIAAKREDLDVLSTMAHEFTHYAMHVLYDNYGFPYHATNDENRTKEFSEIVRICKAIKSQSFIVEDVFRYPPKEHAVELIVRVPQLLTFYMNNPEQIEQIKKSFKKLFDYFQEKTLRDMKTEIPLMESKQLVAELNQNFGVFKRVESSKLSSVRSKIDCAAVISSQRNVEIQTNVPEIVLNNFVKHLGNVRKAESIHIFIEFQQLLNASNINKIKDAFHSKIKPILLVINKSDNDPNTELFEVIKNQLEITKRLVLITKRKISLKNVINIDFTWAELTNDSQNEILKQSLSFLGRKVPLNELMKCDDILLQKEMSLKDISKLHEVVIDLKVPTLPPHIIGRTFQLNDGTETADSSKVVRFIHYHKVAVLAENAGWGKTTSAIKIAVNYQKAHPTNWTVFVDLKHYTKVFVEDDQLNDIVQLTPEFFSQDLMGLEGPLRYLFEHFYRNSKTFFVFDGFDEISPNFKEFVLQMMEIVRISGNRLLITTRIHLEEELEASFPNSLIRIKPLTKAKQIKFLTKFWQHKSPQSPEEDNASKAKHLLEKFKKVSESFLEVPLQLSMIAEIRDCVNISELNLYTSYEQFVNRKLKIWEQRGPLAQNDSTIFHEGPVTVLLAHQNRALSCFYNKDLIKHLQFPENDRIDEERISAIGLIRKTSDSEPEFVHQTFGEYLVANFILNKLTTMAKERTLSESSVHSHSFTGQIMHYFRTNYALFSQMLRNFLEFTENMTNSDDIFGKFFIETLSKEKFKVVRKFINDGLEAKKFPTTEILSMKLKNQLARRENNRLIYELVSEHQPRLTELALESLKVSKTSISYLLTLDSQLEMLQTATGSFKTFEVLWKFMENNGNQYDPGNILFKLCNCSTERASQSSDILEIEKVSKFVLELTAELLPCKEQFLRDIWYNEGYKNALQNVPYAKTFPNIGVLWKEIKSHFVGDSHVPLLRHLLKDYNFKFPIKKYKVNVEVLTEIVLSTLSEDFKSNGSFEKLIFDEGILDFFEDFCAYADFEASSVFWDFIERHLDGGDLKAFVCEKNNGNILKATFWNEDPAGMHFALDGLSRLIIASEVLQVLKQQNEYEDSFITSAFTSGSIKHFIAHLQSLEVNFCRDDVRNAILSSEFVFGENILHRLVWLLRDDASLWNFFLEYLKPLEITGLLFEKYQNNYFCYQNWYEQVPDCIPKWLEQECDFDELVDVFHNKNAKGVTLLHAVAKYCHEDFVQQILDVMEITFDNKTIKEILLAEDSFKGIPCTSSLENNYSESAFQVLWKFHEKIFTRKELIKMYFTYLHGKKNQDKWYEESFRGWSYIYFKKSLEKTMMPIPEKFKPPYPYPKKFSKKQSQKQSKSRSSEHPLSVNTKSQNLKPQPIPHQNYAQCLSLQSSNLPPPRISGPIAGYLK